MIKVSKATLATIKRFPELYKRQAMQVIYSEKSDGIRTTVDCCVMATMLVLIDECGYGTRKGSTRLQRFVKALQETIDTNADFFEDAVAEGLHKRLSDRGVEYDMGVK